MRAWLATLVFAFALAGHAHADERILDYASELAVQTDGSLNVTETIRVRAEGDQIKRGLLRDFPTTYHRPDGSTVKVGFDVLAVRLDGAPEAFSLSHLANGVRIRIGSADQFVSPGEHDYAIDYRTTRQLGFFKDVDELYWNVTGNSWTFPIDHASARITLPGNTQIVQSAVYTGAQGSTSKDARVVSQGPGTISFETTAPLGTNEGLTIAAGWPKGVVSPPSFLRILLDNIKDNLATVIVAIGWLLVAAYYLAAYVKTRRRTPAVIVPLYEPPDGLSAPSVRFIARQGSDPRTFVVGMLELISIRAMRMVKKAAGTSFERTGAKGGTQDPMLAGILAKLFRGDKAFLRDGLEGARFENARRQLEKSLEKSYPASLFQKNRKLANRGLKLWLLYLVLCIGAAWMQDANNAVIVATGLAFMLPALAAFTVFYGSLRRNGFSVGGFFFTLIAAGPFFLGGLATLISVARPFLLGALPGLLPALLFPIVIRAYTFVRGYTDEGYAVMDRIEGFKQYLTLAEGPRLQALVTPEEKLQVYERCLPYAVALDVGKQWAAAFSGMFAGVAAMAAVEAVQQLYGSHDIVNGDPARSVTAFTREVTASSTSSSSSSPGTSSSWSSSSSSSSSGSSGGGSSGGGSSGGGGGGGGGSGW